jgi:hypothetical protein
MKKDRRKTTFDPIIERASEVKVGNREEREGSRPTKEWL